MLSQQPGGYRSDKAGRGLSPVEIHAIHICCHDKEVSSDLLCKKGAGRILVYDCFNPFQPASVLRLVHDGDSAPPVQITIAPCSSSQQIGRISKIRWGRGEGTTRLKSSPSR